MNDNQIILSLLNLYKQRGIDLHYLLDSPIFNKMPFPRQVEMIKEYAGEIAAGIHPGFGKPEMRRAAWDVIPAGITGAATGFATSKGIAKLVGKSAHPLAVAMAALTGLGVGSGVAYMRTSGAVADKDNLKRQFERTAQNPSDENAIQTLEMNSLAKGNRAYEREVINPYLQKVLNKVPNWSHQYASGASEAINKLYEQ